MTFSESFFLISNVWCFCWHFVCTTCDQTTENNIPKIWTETSKWISENKSRDWRETSLKKNHPVLTLFGSWMCLPPRINFFVPRGVPRKKPALFHVERRNLDGPPPQSGVLAGSWRRTNEDAGGCFALKGWMMTFVFVLERKKNWNWSCFAGEDEVHLRIIWKWCMYCIYAVYIYTYT